MRGEVERESEVEGVVQVHQSLQTRWEGLGWLSLGDWPIEIGWGDCAAEEEAGLMRRGREIGSCQTMPAAGGWGWERYQRRIGVANRELVDHDEEGTMLTVVPWPWEWSRASRWQKPFAFEG